MPIFGMKKNSSQTMKKRKGKKMYEFAQPKERKTTTDKCIVFDFDELQAHTFDDTDENGKLNEINFHTVFNDEESILFRHHMYLIEYPEFKHQDHSRMWGLLRPGFYQFIDFCFQHFKIVAVWSAGTHDYVYSVIEAVWRSKNAPHVIFTRNECVEQCYHCGNFDLITEHEHNEESCCENCIKIREPDIILCKPLQKFWNHPIWGKYMRPENTVIIDDRYSVFGKCNVDNGIQVPRFDPPVSIEKFIEIYSCEESDWIFKRLQNFFESHKFVESKDIRKIDKQIFSEEELKDD